MHVRVLVLGCYILAVGSLRPPDEGLARRHGSFLCRSVHIDFKVGDVHVRKSLATVEH